MKRLVKFKRQLSMIMAIVFVIAMLPADVSAAVNQQITDLLFTPNVSELSVTKGETSDLSVEGQYKNASGGAVTIAVDGNDVTWTVDNSEYVKFVKKGSEYATVTGSAVVVKAVTGSAIVTATYGSVKKDIKINSQDAPITVDSVSLNKTELNFNKIGASETLTATVLPADAKADVIWSSSNNSVAKVTTGGAVTAVADGIATVTATAGGKSAACKVTVKTTPDVIAVTSIGLNKTSLSFDTIGASQTLTASVMPANATSKAVTWTTSNNKVATVVNGTVKATGNGTATITAKAGNKTAACKVTVSQKATKVSLNKTSLTFKKIGASEKLTATIAPATAADKNVTWTSSNNKVATVSNGTVKAAGNGTATITAKAANGLKAECKVTVSQASEKVTIEISNQTVSGKTLSVKKGKTYTLKAEVSPSSAASANKKIKWSTSNKKIATVTSAGKVKIVGKGTVKITAKTADNKSATVTFKASTKKVRVSKVTLKADKKTVVAGTKVNLKATVTPVTADNTKLTWTSSNKSVATVSSKGVVTTKKAGKVTITAKAKDGSGKKATVKIKVTAPSKTKITSVKNSKAKTAVIKWNKVSNAKGYEVSMSTSKSKGYKVIKTINNKNTVTLTKTGLKKGKTYYFKVRSFVKVGSKKVYSSYSAVKSVKITK